MTTGAGLRGIAPPFCADTATAPPQSGHVRGRCRVLVDLRRTRAARLPPIGCAGSPAGTPAAPVRPVLGEGMLAGVRPGARAANCFSRWSIAASGGRSHAAGSLRRRRRVLLLQARAVALAPRPLRGSGSSSGGCGFKLLAALPGGRRALVGHHELCHIVKHSTSTKSHLPAARARPR